MLNRNEPLKKLDLDRFYGGSGLGQKASEPPVCIAGRTSPYYRTQTDLIKSHEAIWIIFDPFSKGFLPSQMCSQLLLLSPHPNLLFITPSPLRNSPEILKPKLQYRVKPLIQRTATASNENASGGAKNWEKWMPRNLFAAEKVFGAISGATSSPIAQYISSPTTFLHNVDPRIKMAWLLALVILPAKSEIAIRVGVVLYLAMLSIWVQPTEVWKDQLGRVTLLCGILFILLGLSTDSAPSLLRSRSPPPSLTGLPALPASFEGYKYVVMKLGPLQLTRKGLSAATTAACLTFTIFQSASLCLTTTTPEQLAFALQWFILPLANIGAPVAEIILTLLLSLRFINLVFDEVRNVALGIVSRRIKWEQLTTLETIDGDDCERFPRRLLCAPSCFVGWNVYENGEHCGFGEPRGSDMCCHFVQTPLLPLISSS
ncbi:protein ABCI12, chloroplastic isoform X2 [Andrographis paniculata]|uniref:protein ABCI12, chloroplastic isoform X2 n=1 Tax=Andrographis paniculata TaxID=175694 RepID=UPI0021E70CCF|nr:protein ABCI12, chloroplastic isoform X2 [Andrographis paniculata]